MQASNDFEEFERELRKSVYRFDCPDPQTLGEYQLEMLDAVERTRVAAHALECDACSAELQTLRAYLAAPTHLAEPYLAAPTHLAEQLTARARRVVATLFAPRAGLAYGGLRGSADTGARIFEAGDITVSIASGPASGSLLGLIVAPQSLEDREVRFLPRDGAAHITRVDDLGNFAIEELAAGPYAVEIDLPDGVLVIEELQVD